jgi:glycyl-tRNA synthetase
MTEPLNFQSIILTLQDFWAAHGCVIWQPYYTQVGAGTMNPATFLRVLGPEPWNVGYVEPSVRPDDGRYGENPNRFQQHTQFQVILKPDPGNPVELYIQSLQALGIDPRRHDIRLVEDNWEQPAISAWGLGWEIWLDGQEITQFTYFQQVGGQTLDPVAVEITYGLERILIALRDAPAIWDEPWNETVTYGEVRQREEYEHSKYYFEIGDVARLRQMYDLFEAEANACLEQGLLVPAHDYVLKCSHTFNVLDTRGAIGVTERQGFFGRMRAMSRRVAEAYLVQRQELEYPLLKNVVVDPHTETVQPKILPVVSASQPFLLEIGVEELPAADLDSALAQLRIRVPALLKELHLEHGEVRVCGTPRHLAVHISDLAARQTDVEEEIKGPPADRAFDAAGNPTKAAEGFARCHHLEVPDLQVREVDGGRYIVALVKQAGRPTPQVLLEALPGLVASLKFDKSMRWLPSSKTSGKGMGVSFARPLRWLVALLGEVVIPFEYASLVAGNESRGLRPYGSPQIIIPSAGEYFENMQKNGILMEVAERQERIETRTRELAASVAGEAVMPPELLAEVANLVEKPSPLLGNFEVEYLNLPKDVLISVMKKHQRYFPIEKDGKLLPYFVMVCNGDDQGMELVRSGNEHVVRARFADANFFVREDLKHTLDDFRPQLASLTFQKALGSMLEKANRIEKLADDLIPLLGLDADEAVFARRAAHLCKADLMTRMVVEMTSLQGIMGAEYALRNQEHPAVAKAIGEQYLLVPITCPGLVVALADRLDSLTGLFAAGLLPSATKDPFGLRRAALGVVQPLMDHGSSLDLRSAIRTAAQLEPVPVTDLAQAQVLEFITGRMRVLLLDLGFRHDVVDAVLAQQGHDPALAKRAIQQLSLWVTRPDWSKILPGYARCVRITRDQKTSFDLHPEAFCEPAEKELLAALQSAEKTNRAPGSVDDFLNAFLPMLPAVNQFFDSVMVMAEDETIRHNRLALLQRIARLAEGVADLGRLEGF